MRPVRRNSCCAPPAAIALARVGCANRRVLTGADCTTGAGAGVAAAAADTVLGAGRSVFDAGALGLVSFGGEASIRLTSAGSTFCGLGAA